MGTPFETTAVVEPTVGRVTWDAEGTEGGRYHSRVLHVPTDSSGLTIGRGYDMGAKPAAAIVTDFTKAGMSQEDAEKLSGAAGLRGDDARAFITTNGLQTFEITPAVQKNLFEITYEAEAAEARRLCTKQDVVGKYGATDWDALDQPIREMLVDLKFRGDYDGRARGIIQKYVVADDLEGFAKAMADKGNWRNVPSDRFERRNKFLDAAIQAKKTPAPNTPIGG